MSVQHKITRDDLERELRGFQSKIVSTVESKRSTIVTGVAVGAVVLALVFFLMGRRSGRKKSTIVEVRRF